MRKRHRSRQRSRQPAAPVVTTVDTPAAPSPPADLPPAPDVGPGAMLGKLLPELSVVATAGLLLVWPGTLSALDADTLAGILAADLLVVFAGATLVDIASRLQRPPPIWLGVLIATTVFGIAPGLLGLLPALWQEGLWVLLPFIWSLLERGRELWTLPAATRLEKIRRRTLAFDRAYTALFLGALYVAALIVNELVHDGAVAFGSYLTALPIAVLLYYGIAAFNAWRVHRRAFACRPRSLWPWIDSGQSQDLSPI